MPRLLVGVGEPITLIETSGIDIDHENDTTYSHSWLTAGVSWICTTAGGVARAVATALAVRWILSKVKFSSCTVSSPAHCVVQEPIETANLTGTILKIEEVELAPEAGSEFAKVKFMSSGVRVSSPEL